MFNIIKAGEQIIERKQLVSQGIELLLSLFNAAGQQRIFPREIMTKYTRGQITVYNKEQILYWFEKADYQDCRINAYPAFISKAEEQDYKQGTNLDLFTPNILFIDLDATHFRSREVLDKWLSKILRNIANLLHGVKPLVLWSGHGYHIIIPVKAAESLEQFEDFEPYTYEPSKEFLQFAARYLSLNKCDSSNNPAFKSCLLRVPYTFNSKCLDEDEDSEVRVIHDWSNSEQLPEINNLLIEFQTYLVSSKLKAEIRQEKRITSQHIFSNDINTISYIEKLLNIQINDHRKFAISLILAPYFVNIQNLSDANSFDKIMQWILRCNELEKVKPSMKCLYDLIKRSIERARKTGIKPLRFEETLSYKNSELYYILK